jgi:hypothetical protein
MKEEPNELYKVTVTEYDIEYHSGALHFNGEMTRLFYSLCEAQSYKVYWEIDDNPHYIWRATIEKVS